MTSMYNIHLNGQMVTIAPIGGGVLVKPIIIKGHMKIVHKSGITKHGMIMSVNRH